MDRFAGIKPFYVMEILERAQEMERDGRSVIHMEVGEPDFDTPVCVREAAARAMADGHTHYTHSQGMAALREAVCADYVARYGVDVHPEQVFITSGTSPAMLLAFSVLLEPGQAAIIADPGYACYAAFVEYSGGRALRVPVREGDGFQFRAETVRAHLDPSVGAVMVNSPANPAGTLAELGVPIVSDEIYPGLEYGPERARSMLEFTDECFVLNGFSKLYAMTGWRLGYLIAPRRYVPTLRKLAQNLFICAGSVAQWAGLAALTCAAEDVERMRRTYDERRRFLVPKLRELGFGIAVEPLGAFYVLANAKAFTSDSLAFAFDILDKAGVGVTPGIDFGPGGEGYIRLSYANSLDNIREGMNRLETYLKQLSGAPR